MATIVQHHKSNQRYVLVGAGFGMYQSSRPHAFWGELARQEDGGAQELLCVCGMNGDVGWVATSEVTVISVDGKSPKQHLDSDSPYR